MLYVYIPPEVAARKSTPDEPLRGQCVAVRPAGPAPTANWVRRLAQLPCARRRSRRSLEPCFQLILPYIDSNANPQEWREVWRRSVRPTTDVVHALATHCSDLAKVEKA